MIDLPLFHQGKVRDIYEVDDEHLLIVTSDRISAFDVVLPTLIPNKGRVLTWLSKFWFDKTRHIVPNHLTNITIDITKHLEAIGRSMMVRKVTPLPYEAIVRGYLMGSGWKDYQKTGEVCGIELPTGLQLAEQLPEPIFTPSTKAEHDENISYERMESRIGEERAAQVRDISLQLYKEAAEHALDNEIIIADTKFEFGVDSNGELLLIDELLTPDSSRFWDVNNYQPGISPPSFDKQFVRDYLETVDWDKTDPGPELPNNVVEYTMKKYYDAIRRLRGWA